MKELKFSSMFPKVLPLAVALLTWPFMLTVPAKAPAQAVSKDAKGTPASELESRGAQYRSVILQLAEIESEILKLKKSDVQREFENLKLTLETLQSKRKLLRGLENQWSELGEGNKSALEIEPGLNSTEQTEQRMLVELETSKENVLRLKTEILKLKSEFGPGHPSILKSAEKLADMESVVEEQTESLELLGVEVKSSVAKAKLRSALFRQADLKSKFGAGHRKVAEVEAEIEMLRGEVLRTPSAPATGVTPSTELVNTSLQLREASTKFGAGHPILKSLRQKVEVLEKIAQSEAAQEAPENKAELARRLEARIALLQTRIFEDEAKLDSFSDNQSGLKGFEQKNALLMMQRKALNKEMERLAPALTPPEQLGKNEQEHISKQLLGGIDALESLGKSDEANRLREILSDLEE